MVWLLLLSCIIAFHLPPLTLRYILSQKLSPTQLCVDVGLGMKYMTHLVPLEQLHLQVARDGRRQEYFMPNGAAKDIDR
jgi:hypothetical protein